MKQFGKVQYGAISSAKMKEGNNPAWRSASEMKMKGIPSASPENQLKITRYRHMYSLFPELFAAPTGEEVAASLTHKTHEMHPIALTECASYVKRIRRYPIDRSIPVFAVSMGGTHRKRVGGYVTKEKITLTSGGTSLVQSTYSTIEDFFDTVLAEPLITHLQKKCAGDVCVLSITPALPLLPTDDGDRIISTLMNKTFIQTPYTLSDFPLKKTISQLLMKKGIQAAIKVEICPNDTIAVQTLYDEGKENVCVAALIAGTGGNMSIDVYNTEVGNSTLLYPTVLEKDFFETMKLGPTGTGNMECIFSAKVLDRLLVQYIEVVLGSNSSLVMFLHEQPKPTIDGLIFSCGYDMQASLPSFVSDEELLVCRIVCELLCLRAAQYTASLIYGVEMVYVDHSVRKKTFTVFGDGSVLTKNPAHVAMINALYRETSGCTDNVLYVPCLHDLYESDVGADISSVVLDATLLATLRRGLGSTTVEQ